VAVIYLASPYSHINRVIRQQRFEEACRIAATLIQEGHIVFCPVAYSHTLATIGKLPGDWGFWEKFDMEFLLRSDKLVVAQMDGWRESVGVSREIEIARENGIPVEFLKV